MSNDAKTKEKVRIAVFFGLCILLVAGIFVSIGSGTMRLSVTLTAALAASLCWPLASRK